MSQTLISGMCMVWWVEGRMRARCMGWRDERVLSGNTVTLALVALASGLQRSTRMRIHFTVSGLLLIGLYVIQAVSISKDKCGAFRLICFPISHCTGKNNRATPRETTYLSYVKEYRTKPLCENENFTSQFQDVVSLSIYC